MNVVCLCGLCYDSITENEGISVTKCGHIFHYGCLQDFAICPSCRQGLDICERFDGFRLLCVNVVDLPPTSDEIEVLRRQFEFSKGCLRLENDRVNMLTDEKRKVEEQLESLKCDLNEKNEHIKKLMPSKEELLLTAPISIATEDGDGGAHVRALEMLLQNLQMAANANALAFGQVTMQNEQLKAELKQMECKLEMSMQKGEQVKSSALGQYNREKKLNNQLKAQLENMDGKAYASLIAQLKSELKHMESKLERSEQKAEQVKSSALGQYIREKKLNEQLKAELDSKKHYHPTTANQRKGGNFCSVCKDFVHAAIHCYRVEHMMDALDELFDGYRKWVEAFSSTPFNDLKTFFEKYDPSLDYLSRKKVLVEMMTLTQQV